MQQQLDDEVRLHTAAELANDLATIEQTNKTNFMNMNRHMMKMREARQKGENDIHALQRELNVPPIVREGNEQKVIDEKRQEIAKYHAQLQKEKARKEELDRRKQAFGMIMERIER